MLTTLLAGLLSAIPILGPILASLLTLVGALV